jgi:Homeodomain-like domain
MRHFHEPAGSNESNDPANWDRASYKHHPCDDFEPLPDAPNDYRAAALYHLQLMYAVDEFIMAAEDARAAIVAVAVVLGWPSTRGWTVPEIAEQLGVSASTITRACDRFREMSGLPAGGFRLDHLGAGFWNGDKTPAVRA